MIPAAVLAHPWREGGVEGGRGGGVEALQSARMRRKGSLGGAELCAVQSIVISGALTEGGQMNMHGKREGDGGRDGWRGLLATLNKPTVFPAC